MLVEKEYFVASMKRRFRLRKVSDDRIKLDFKARTKDAKNYSSSQELLRNHFLRRLPSPTQKHSKKTLFIHCFIGTNRYQTCQLNNNELSNW